MSHDEKRKAASFSNLSLQTFLWGRKLLIEECHPFPIKEIRKRISQNVISVEPGIDISKGIPVCNRCGNSDPERFGAYSCARCQHHCHYCRACLLMGVVKTCSELLTWSGPPPQLPKYETITVHWDGTLSPLQRRASDALKAALLGGRDFLIWAVTGAGKTEIFYETLGEALRQGLRVGIVSPRVDVVLELSARMKPVFAGVPAITLYGDSPDTYADVPLIFSTIHQLLRFHQRFDVFFIDEVDAFPFHHNPLLEKALHRAGKPGYLRFYLTATPDERLKKLFLTKKLDGIKIPRRFHGHPLPEPRFQWIGAWQKRVARGRIPVPLKRWVERRLALGHPGFVFVPTIEVAERLGQLLQAVDPAIDYAHSEDPRRHDKVAAFRKGHLPILVTTTILERGVTIPKLDVAVLGADEAIFDERALVQIGGRVGRSADHPDGDLVFFHQGLTVAMLKALRHIREMNCEAKDIEKS